jgi:hypothetical protein
VGFVELDRTQVLLSVDGKLNVLGVGESVSGLEVVGIEPPLVKLKHYETELQIDLVTQPWFYVANEKPTDRKPPRSSTAAPTPGRGPARPNPPVSIEASPPTPPTIGAATPPTRPAAAGLPALPAKGSSSQPKKK